MESNLKKYTIVYLTVNTKNNKIYVGIHDTLNPNKFDGYIGCGININYPSSIKRPSTPFMYAVKKYGFEINDLYAASINLPEEAHSDPVHYYTVVGTEVFANKVLSYIVPELDTAESIIYKEELYTDKPIGI